MGSEWTEACLSELTSKITKGTTPSKKDGGFTNKGINFIKAEAVDINGYIDISRFVFITNDVYEKYKRSQLKADDILFSMAGVILGKVGLVNKDHLPANINQALALIRPIQKIIYPRYLYYYLIQREVYNFVNNSTAQSAQPNINLQEIGKLKIRFPHFRKQQEIAHILGVLDDKIELNRKMNETLESMAQALFKSWFVDFDPVIDNALAAGNDIPEVLQERAAARQALGDKRKPLPEEIQKLFPGSFVFSDDELGWMPASWQVAVISDLSEKISKGTTPRKQDFEDAEEEAAIPFLKVKDIDDRGYIKTSGIELIPKSIHEVQLKRSVLKENDVLFSIAGSIGRSAIVPKELNNSNINQAIAFIRPKDTEFSYFLLQLMRSNYIQNRVKSRIVQAVQANFSLTELGNIPITKADNEILKVWSNLVNPVLEKIAKLQIELILLEKTRETLLPKLLSGELRIPDAEKLIEEAV